MVLKEILVNPSLIPNIVLLVDFSHYLEKFSRVSLLGAGQLRLSFALQR